MNRWFDSRGELIATHITGQAMTKYEYDGAGRNTAVFSVDSLNGTSAASADIVLSQTVKTLDANGNPIFAVSADRLPLASDTTTGELTSTSIARISYSAAFYDGADRLTASADFGTNDPGTTAPSLPSTSSTVRVTAFTYDAAGNQSSVTDPRNLTSTQAFDALHRLTLSTDAAGNTIAYTYDGSDHVLTMTASNVSGTTTTHQTTAYLYGVSTSTGSDINSNDILSAVQYPDLASGNASGTQQASYTVNALGEQTTMTDRNGAKHTYGHDALGRLTSDAITVATGNPHNIDTTVTERDYSYDSAGNAIGFTAKNGSTIVSNVSRSYNGFGQVTSETQSKGTVSATVSYAYDMAHAGRLTSITYPTTSLQLNYYYNGIDGDVSRISSIYSQNGTNALVPVENYAYMGLGTPMIMGRGNGITENISLDAFGQVSEVNWGADTALDQFRYTYDADGNVMVKENVTGTNSSEVYGYDNLNRLTSFKRGVLSGSTIPSPTASESWTLDSLGNWNTHTIGTTTNTASFNTQNQNTSLGYDANGNQTTDENGASLKYDGWNDLVGYSGTSGTVSYSYDALGRRNAENAGGTTTNLYYSTAWQVLEERQNSSMIAQNVFSPTYVDAPIERTSINGTTTTTLWFQHDANYNTTSLSDNNGTIVARMVYTPYGVYTVTSDTTGLGGAFASTVKFFSQGRRFDPTTGTYDSRERIYGPTTGTFDQQEPFGALYYDGMNLYKFVDDTPVLGVDPQGLADSTTQPSATKPAPYPAGFEKLTDRNKRDWYFKTCPAADKWKGTDDNIELPPELQSVIDEAITRVQEGLAARGTTSDFRSSSNLH